MAKTPRIEGTAEAWEARELGSDEEFIKISNEIKEDALNESLELQMISIRLQKSLIEDIKMIARLNGLSYQPLIRQILNRFAESEKKQLLKELHAAHKKAESEEDPDGDDKLTATG